LHSRWSPLSIFIDLHLDVVEVDDEADPELRLYSSFLAEFEVIWDLSPSRRWYSGHFHRNSPLIQYVALVRVSVSASRKMSSRSVPDARIPSSKLSNYGTGNIRRMVRILLMI
jgi:hypothetical protein